MPDAARRLRRLAHAGVFAGMTWLACSCAGKPTSAPVLQPALAPAYPEFDFPTVPAALHDVNATAALDRGWQYLQRNDLPAAQREFAAAVGGNQTFYPALAAQGYAALGGGEPARALQAFDEALRLDRSYLPAMTGRGRALLALDRLDEALAVFDAAATQDPSLGDLRNRVDVLRFRSLQSKITDARAAAAAGRTAEARAAYQAAIATSPDSGFLYRELASVERAAGDDTAVIAHLRRAIELDAADAAAHVELGAALERQSDLTGALRAYTAAADLQPDAALAAKVATLTERVRDAQLPAQFRALPGLSQVTRGDLAALIGVRLESLVSAAPRRAVVTTDTRGHWAATWMAQVVDAGIMPAYDNHTFQPSAAMRRVDLADTAARLLRLVPPSPRITAARTTTRPAMADVQPSHLNYRAIVDVVNAGVMPLVDGRFLPARAVTGAEAIEVIARLQALVATGP
jgi:tetratricopeptide (TPR) repeat protein